MDFWLIIIFMVGFGGFLYGVLEVFNCGWGDVLVLFCIVIGIIFIVFFVYW